MNQPRQDSTGGNRKHVASNRRCEHCGAIAHLDLGLCLHCLFSEAATPIDSAELESEELNLLLRRAVRFRTRNSTFGHYDLLDEIGRGGIGVIYRARDRRHGRIIAVKRLLDYQAESAQTRARFRREAQAAAALDHPNILPIYEVSETADSVPFFTMKLISRSSLLQCQDQFSDPQKAVRLVLAVAAAVAHAHHRGILHRDLKPGNILIDEQDVPYVTDFGLAKWLDDSPDLTQTLTVFGTPGYIAPEQANGPSRNVTAAADVYSLGAILFELLSGRPPFFGEHAFSVLRQAAEKPAPRLRSVSASADRTLELICARCLQREPRDRYDSALQLADDLRGWLDGKRVTVARPSLRLRTSRVIRRNKVLTMMFAMLVIVGTLGLLAQLQYFHGASTSGPAVTVLVLPTFDLDAPGFDSGGTEALTTRLAAAASTLGIRVTASVAHSPSDALRQISRSKDQVAPSAIIASTKRHLDEQVRLSLVLLEPASNRVLWHLDLDQRQLGIADMQKWRELADKVQTALIHSRDLSGARDDLPDDPVAREAIVAGRQLKVSYSVTDLDRAIDLFNAALQRCPNSALIHSYLAEVAAGRTHYIADAKLAQLAEEHARKALELAPESAEAHRAAAAVQFVEGNFDSALAELLRTAELGGAHNCVCGFIANTVDILGHPDQAIRWYQLSDQWDSRPGEEYGQMADCWTRLIGDEKAEAAYRKAAALHPDLQTGWVGLCHLRLLQHDTAAAFAILREHVDGRSTTEAEQMSAQVDFLARNFAAAETRYSTLAARDPLGGGSFYGNIDYRSAIARARQALGYGDAEATLLECRTDETTKLRRAPTNPETSYRLAAIESCLGHSSDSIEYLRSAANHGWIDWRSAELDPRFDNVRALPTFEAVLDTAREKTTTMRRNLSAKSDNRL